MYKGTRCERLSKLFAKWIMLFLYPFSQPLGGPNIFFHFTFTSQIKIIHYIMIILKHNFDIILVIPIKKGLILFKQNYWELF